MRKKFFLRNLTIMILGGVGLSTWMAGACNSVDDNESGTTLSALTNANDALEAVTQVPADYGITPGGVLMHKSCVHELPNGAVMSADDLSVTLNGKKIAQYAACTHKRYRLAKAATDGVVPGTGNGWVESSWGQSVRTQFNHLDTGYWLVPANPVNHSQTIFLFPSLENGDVSIIQPVLQWGNSAAGGGASWAYANWYVSPSAAAHSALTATAVGRQFWGSMDMYNQIGSNQYWNVQIKDVTANNLVSTNFIVASTNPFNWAQVGVLEAYNVSTCDSFPSGSSGQTYFPIPVVTQGNSYNDRNFINPSWFTRDWVSHGWTGPNCGLGVTVGSTGATWLNY